MAILRPAPRVEYCLMALMRLRASPVVSSVARQHEIGVGLVPGAADAPAQLVKVGESEAVGAVDDDGIGVGDVDAGSR